MANDKEWPIEGRTVRLAHDHLAEPVDGKLPFKKPPTVSGEVNVGMDHTIYLPSLEQQVEGFTPYMIVRDGDDPVDATRELLRQFPGIYKAIAAETRPEKQGDTEEEAND